VYQESDEYQLFEIQDELTRDYRRFSAEGRQITVSLKPPPYDTDPVSHFLASVEELFAYALRNVGDGDIVGLTIRNQENENDRPIGFSFRRKDQISGEVIWSVFEKVSQSNSRFNAMDKLVIDVHSVKMPVGFGKKALKTKGRPLSVMAHLKRSIVEVQA
jgi:hypothetical protein